MLTPINKRSGNKHYEEHAMLFLPETHFKGGERKTGPTEKRGTDSGRQRRTGTETGRAEAERNGRRGGEAGRRELWRPQAHNSCLQGRQDGQSGNHRTQRLTKSWVWNRGVGKTREAGQEPRLHC